MKRPATATVAPPASVADDERVDDYGNPITEDGDDRVDDNGMPVAASTAAPTTPAPIAPTGHGATGTWDAPTPETPKSVLGFLGNIPASGMRMAEGVGQMVLHPKDTLSAMGDVALGGVQKLRQTVRPNSTLNPGGSAMERDDPTLDKSPIFDAFVHSLKERYGSASKIGNTLYEDPIGSALDVAGLMSGGSTMAASRFPAVSKFLKTASEVVDPLTATSKLASKTGRGIAKAAKQIEGSATGVGPEVIGIAARADVHPDLIKFMRGKGGTHRDVVDTVLDALAKLKDRRRTAYQDRLAEIPNDFMLDTRPINAAMKESLTNFGVKARTTKEGKLVLDFSRSKLTGDEAAKVNAAFQDVMSWGTKPEDFRPLTVDTLKQRLGDLVSAKPGKGDAAIQPVIDAARELLEQQVPGYKQMTAEYAQSSQFLKELSSELSLGGSEGAIVRKLSNALNQKPSYRSDLIDAIDITFGTDVKGQIAGLELQSYVPRGLMGRLAVSGVAGGMGTATMLGKLGEMVSNPAALAAALAGTAAFSPRLVGELMAAIANFRSMQVVQMMGASASAAKRVVFDPKTFRLVQESVKAKKSAEGRDQVETEMHNWLIKPRPKVEP